MVTIKIGGKDCYYDEGIKYEAIAQEYQKEYDEPIALVVVDGKIRELMKKVNKDCTLDFITYKNPVGHKTYVRTAIMLMMKAIQDEYGVGSTNNVKVEFTIGPGYYCSTRNGLVIDADGVAKIKSRMETMIATNIPFTKKAYAADDAIELFRKLGMTEKEKLFKYRRSSSINVYCLGDYYDYYYGYMMPSTSYITKFDLIPYEDGMMLVLPQYGNGNGVEEFVPRPKLFDTLRKTTEWSNAQGLDSVGDLNDYICAGNIEELILVQEAQQERRIGEIAKQISEREGVKFVMIAGPSSSGKTTFSHRLSVQLRTYGLTPHPIALDNYYKNHEDTPLDEDGNPDYECLDALDVEQFNEDMCRLLEGERVELPTYNFKTGKREYKGDFRQLGEDDILVIEGIHGLNEKMSHSLPAESKFKVYISALTALNVDDHNRIPTTDGRLLRRMVRDARTRGASAKQTLEMWPSVRKGEELYIFPFQEEADAMFNSTLIYELAVLKMYAEPLLYGIQKGEPEYFEARRLLKFLEYFLAIDSASLPNNSLVREFVGGGCFNL